MLTRRYFHGRETECDVTVLWLTLVSFHCQCDERGLCECDVTDMTDTCQNMCQVWRMWGEKHWKSADMQWKVVHIFRRKKSWALNDHDRQPLWRHVFDWQVEVIRRDVGTCQAVMSSLSKSDVRGPRDVTDMIDNCQSLHSNTRLLEKVPTCFLCFYKSPMKDQNGQISKLLKVRGNWLALGLG